jgi:hypothetical protein
MIRRRKTEEEPKLQTPPPVDVRGDNRGTPPPGYKVGDRVERGMERYLSLFDNASQWTGISGCFCPADLPARRHRMSRVTMIRVVWPQYGMVDAKEAKSWGWWPGPEQCPPSSVPHFAIDQEGQVVQFLDPGINGSDFMRDPELDRTYPPEQTIVIAAMSPYKNPVLAVTVAQRVALDRLLNMLATAFLRPRVELYGYWKKAVNG